MGATSIILTGDDVNNIESELDQTADFQNRLLEKEQSSETEKPKEQSLKLLEKIPANLGTTNNIKTSKM
jgi:hypothetical protein